MTFWQRCNVRTREAIVETAGILFVGACAYFPEVAGALWRWIGDSKEQLLTIGTIVLAVATYLLFRKTADMASATVALADAAKADSLQSDRQHQQLLSGQLDIKELAIKLETRQSRDAAADGPPISGETWEQRLYLNGILQNVGSGPALTGKISVRFPDITVANVPLGKTRLERRVGAFASGERAPLNTPDGIPVSWPIVGLSRPLRSNEMPQVVVRLEWTTIFNGVGWVEYTAEIDVRFFRRESIHMPDYVPAS